MIKVLISKNKEELEEINILEITSTILEFKKVLQKRNLINQLQTKCEDLDIVFQRFHTKFNVLNHKGLPGLIDLDEKLNELEDNCKKLYIIVVDKSKFAGIKRQITGKEFLEAL